MDGNRNTKKKPLKRNILIVVFVVGVISAIVLNFTRARYRVTESIPLVNGIINYTPGDIIISAYYNGELMDTFPTKDSGYTVESITCDNNATASFNEDTWSIKVNNLVTRATKCDVYFEENLFPARDTILANKDIRTRGDFSTALSTNTNGIIYQEETSEGTTYYFAGDTDENWVSFAGYYWRIIRINEDGSIRMIYNGTTTAQIGTTTQVQTSTFNSSYNNNMYVGYMYQSNQVHGLTSNSTIKGIVDGWYEENLLGEPEEDLISTEAGLCGDRTPSTSSYGSNGSGGTGTTTTYYGAYIRLLSNKTPTFKCDNSSDLYTVDESSKGNHALDYPIGLITADEVAFAGGLFNKDNESYYLNTGESYWVMSPSHFSSNTGYIYNITSTGNLYRSSITSSLGVRPVINLNKNIK